MYSLGGRHGALVAQPSASPSDHSAGVRGRWVGERQAGDPPVSRAGRPSRGRGDAPHTTLSANLRAERVGRGGRGVANPGWASVPVRPSDGAWSRAGPCRPSDSAFLQATPREAEPSRTSRWALSGGGGRGRAPARGASREPHGDAGQAGRLPRPRVGGGHPSRRPDRTRPAVEVGGLRQRVSGPPAWGLRRGRPRRETETPKTVRKPGPSTPARPSFFVSWSRCRVCAAELLRCDSARQGGKLPASSSPLEDAFPWLTAF